MHKTFRSNNLNRKNLLATLLLSSIILLSSLTITSIPSTKAIADFNVNINIDYVHTDYLYVKEAYFPFSISFVDGYAYPVTASARIYNSTGLTGATTFVCIGQAEAPSVIYNYGLLFVFITLLISSILFLLRNSPGILKPVQVVICFLLFLILYITGKNTGENIAKEVRVNKTLPPVVFEFKDTQANSSGVVNRNIKKLYDANRKGLLQYITENSSSYFAVYQPGDNPPLDDAVRGYVFEIPRSRVKSITKIIDK